MTVNLNIPEGLVFAIDFRYNGKDAWYRSVGSITGTLANGATISGGAAVFDSGNDVLFFSIDNASQCPAIAGSVIADYIGTADGSAQVVINLQPNATTAANNRISIYRATGGQLRANVTSSSGVEVNPITVGALGNTRQNIIVFWEGFNGSSGTANCGVGSDGASPSTVLGGTVTRTEVSNTGQIHIGNFTGSTFGSNGSIYKSAIFNLTNPCGQDLTVSGWSADHIWDEIFPSGLSTGISRFTGVSLNGDYRFGSGVKFIAR